MSVATQPYETWLIIEREDHSLATILADLDIRRVTDSSTRSQTSLQRQGDYAVLNLSEPDLLFTRLAAERRPISAISLAPWPHIQFFDGKLFNYKGLCYSIRRAKMPAESPYARRFLDLEYAPLGINPDFEAAIATKVIPMANSSSPPLWLDPVHVKLSEQQIIHLFHPVKGCAISLTSAFFLPPVRSMGSPDVQESYFQERLVKLRRRLADLGAHGAELERRAVANHDTSVSIVMMRLLDEPMLRDFLLDGASLRVVGNEGDPTEILLELFRGGGAAAAYRTQAILEPDGLAGPSWGRQLARVLRNDIESLGPTKLLLAYSGATTAVTWRVSAVRDSITSGAREGTWTKLREICDLMGPSVEAATFDSVVLGPCSRIDDTSSFPDHDLAEKLFVVNVWRCPWTDDPDDKAWRHAMVQIIRDEELTGRRPAPEERIEVWKDATQVEGRQDYSSRRREDGVLLFRYSGMPDPKQLLQWRLLLPLGTIINARTLYLDVTGRCRLDSGYVLG